MPLLDFLKSQPAAHSIGLTLTHDHGYVLAVLVATVLTLNGWMAVQVGKARKRFGVAYPALYADSSNANANTFNCIQRAHQNTVAEAAPAHYALLITAALVAGGHQQKAVAACGALWLVGRILYFIGYSTGTPSNRMRGAFANFGSLGLLVIVAKAACALLRG